ncbi:hypothetical protein COZ61_00125 [Candidatus Berkelbacteria bacterium CG_4_8_14_3_um_filter_33_6]|uniref:Large ribosomal subunit protein uL1 n=1 Tax=Candidatus Berkelbacteria bacterium CG_4_10_14_0_2_um_filter_35_9_33_12 TaxID=1974499 RepID=A0A2M7W4I0_9BACT|nr:MAG: hypothetical protein COX10_01355 [Candidatus Berkelbacteria bacterium CG23_combo_of_CG06-09_8_20_14_all_33_15]PIS08525.1 MAG: hypothetical protein COT76_00940 [Candidatus Berkelbacteria bacterium CG10_big_fil_rev_8_21_14_0_10_33_10]PIX31364.1 MAG: hypothetical protein COZ61_00125 [Candidatus Berkelbacteria bacterium CG_4_8_14_3_um_filter_33_6]PIZ28188.1 MAG: hypothetical protein COY43_01840 [Candidatus Berkelbacteria bacterium CG_4_10_14_0_8_um_filter_35_9_33_8]PJA20716.1 MAG: hypotheti
MGQQKTKIIGVEVEDTQKKVDKKSPRIVKEFKKEVVQSEVNKVVKKVEKKKKSAEVTSRKRFRFPRSKKYIVTKEDMLKLVKSGDLDSILTYLTKNVAKHETIELAINLTQKKGQDPVRKMINLPAGLVKTPKIVICNDDILSQLEKNIIDFDILITLPKMMSKLAKFAKILGPKGLMPNPKSGTVTEKPEEAKKELMLGNVEVKQDKTNIIHLPVGKIDWGVEKISKNIEAVIKEVPSNRVVSIFISSSQSPSFKLK